MKSLKARVENGHIRVNEPTTFPDGTEFDLTVAETGDDLDERERAALHAALETSWTQARAGSARPMKTVLGRK